jgi:hypothetical protein
MDARSVCKAKKLGLVVTAVLVTCAVLAQNPPPPAVCGNGPFNIEQALSDQAQRTTIAFAGLALVTGNLEAQSFFPPGKLVDYWGFQYLRDNDPDNMGHNTSFLTRVSCNVLYVLDDAQMDRLKALASGQVAQINEYGLKRYPLMKAFRRLVEGDLPPAATGLDLDAVKAASRELYELDGQLSFDRAAAYADLYRSLDPTQKSYLDAMVGRGWASWPDRTMDDVREKMRGLSHDESVAVMTYAGDLFSWYAGCVAADIYFCPERHGTYYGGFYIKDAPAIGHEGYSIDETLTATAGAALCDSSKGYVTPEQAALASSLTDLQRNNLYAGSSNIVQARTDISAALRGLIGPTAPNAEEMAQIKATVLAKSAEYGELDGENNYHYATVFAQLKSSLSADQLSQLGVLRHSILSGTYADGTPFDFTVCDTYYLFSAQVEDPSVLDPYIGETDYLFALPSAPQAAFAFTPAAPVLGQTLTFADASTGSPNSWSWSFGDGGTSTQQNPTHSYAAAGTYTVTLVTANAGGTSTATHALTVTPACTITGVQKAQDPFRLKIFGSGFKAGCKATIDGWDVPLTIFKGVGQANASGNGLKAHLPEGQPVQIVVTNPDGGTSAPYLFTR